MELAKLAASFDARRSKQYWQMLKRLHGGNDEAIQAVKSSGDDGIWHGTLNQHADSIQANGLKKGIRAGKGAGVYFGDKDAAGFYATRGLEERALFRLKKPSELAGTKELYPKSDKLVNFDAADPNMTRSIKSNMQQGFDETLEAKEYAIQKQLYKHPRENTLHMDFKYDMGRLKPNSKYKKTKDADKQLMNERMNHSFELDEWTKPNNPEYRSYAATGKTKRPFAEEYNSGEVLFRDTPVISPKLLHKQAFTEIRESMEKIASYYQQ